MLTVEINKATGALPSDWTTSSGKTSPVSSASSPVYRHHHQARKKKANFSTKVRKAIFFTQKLLWQKTLQFTLSLQYIGSCIWVNIFFNFSKSCVTWSMQCLKKKFMYQWSTFKSNEIWACKFPWINFYTWFLFHAMKSRPVPELMK